MSSSVPNTPSLPGRGGSPMWPSFAMGPMRSAVWSTPWELISSSSASTVKREPL
jgi:hypothetical protein